jgi:hypothetical protein
VFVHIDVPRSGLDATVVLIRGDVDVAAWPLSGRRPALALVDELARLQLAARRMGCRIELRGPGADLLALLDLVGLREIFRVAPLRVEAVGETEDGEQTRIDEVVVPDDPVP